MTEPATPSQIVTNVMPNEHEARIALLEKIDANGRAATQILHLAASNLGSPVLRHSSLCHDELGLCAAGARELIAALKNGDIAAQTKFIKSLGATSTDYLKHFPNGVTAEGLAADMTKADQTYYNLTPDKLKEAATLANQVRSDVKTVLASFKGAGLAL